MGERLTIRINLGTVARNLAAAEGRPITESEVRAFLAETGFVKQAMSIELTSTGFQAGAEIPKQYTGDGADLSPPLRWSEPPSTTRSIALIRDDPDAPGGTWVHWVLFNLPARVRELKEGVPTTGTFGNGAMQGKNDFGKIGYGGPAPPPGKPHRYFFKLYALDVAVNLAAGATKAQLEAAMKGHIVAEGQLMGTYQR
jgi:Raf kinase inhibitor-like YbhB/YbcL family protein